MNDEVTLAKRAREVLAGEPSPIPSPCSSVCRMNAASGLCEGCLRTIDEIVEWGTMSDQDKRGVWVSIAARAPSQES